MFRAIVNTPNLARVGALIGDNTRARMLTTLMHGKALTASELARDAGITAQTASTHLAKLEEGGLLTLHKQGRHKYFALAGEEVAGLLESLMGFTVSNSNEGVFTGPRDNAMRKARVCYNHLAGDMGIRLYDSLLHQKFLVMRDGTPCLSQKGEQFVTEFGIDLATLRAGKSPLCRSCLDWSERRFHLAGSLGRALYTCLEERRWVKRGEGRAVIFSSRGEREFHSTFPVP